MGDSDNRVVEHPAHTISLKIGDLVVDFARREVYRGTERIPLAPKPFEVLEVLVKNSGRIVSKDELLAAVWGEAHKDRNTVEQAVRQIRLALGDDADHPRFIQTFPRQGYSFIPPCDARASSKTGRARFHGKHYFYLVILLLVITGIAALRVFHSPPRELSARVTFSPDSVQAFSAEGRLLWAHKFSGSFDPTGVQGLTLSKLGERVRFADLRGDGNQEVIVVAPIRVSPNPEDRWHTEIDCFSGSSGKLLWSYTPREVLRFGDAELRGPWDVSDVLVSRQTPKPSVWVAFNHYEWGNAFVEQIDPMTGLGTTRYVNSGTIHALNEMHTSHAMYLLAGGFNNEHDGGSLAVIDESKPFAASPQTAGSRHQCVNCPQGVPDDYLVFPRSEISNVRKEYENSVRSISVNGDQFEVSQPEFPESSGVARSIYRFQFDSAIRPVSLRYSSTYEMLHRDFEASGTLLHSLAACPERLRPAPIRLWTPSEGWKELQVKPVQ